ncbi:MAG: hypothetical protein ACRCTI_08470 [Beijerinckiaceae bacterium]
MSMIFAPAMGIAACQVLAALCGLIAALFAILGLKNWIVGGDVMPPAQAFLFAAVFLAGAVVCRWFVKLIRRLAHGE